MEGFDRVRPREHSRVAKIILRESTDEYKENLMRVINAKMKGKTPRHVAGDHGPKQADVVDLMARLRASLESGTTGKARAKKTGSPRGTAASKRGKRKRVA